MTVQNKFPSHSIAFMTALRAPPTLCAYLYESPHQLYSNLFTWTFLINPELLEVRTALCTLLRVYHITGAQKTSAEYC